MNKEVKKNHFSIGKMVATHGLNGELVLQHALGKTSLHGLQAIFIKEKTGALLPWFIETLRTKNEEEVFIKLEGIETKETAKTLVPKEVWLAEADFGKYADTAAPISLLGFTVIDDGKPLGVIEEIIEQPHQVIGRLTIGNKEVLIPLHEESLKKIDQRKKTISVDLPEGLLDIYLK